MFKSILVPTEGTWLSDKPMETAIEFARQSKGKLVVLSVAEPLLFNSLEADALSDAQIMDTINIKTVKSNVKKALDAAERACIPWEAVVSKPPRPCSAIQETGLRFQCDLIVMAMHGKAGVIDTLFDEGMTQGILRRFPVPALVFPQD